jgi:hypothetical protein
MYTAGHQAEVEVSPGETTLVSRPLVAGTGHLTIADAPPGGTVTIDGSTADSEKVLSTGIDVPAGWMDVSVQGPTSLKWSDSAFFVGADSDTRRSVNEMNLVLPRRTIQLNGKTDSWAGIEPLSGAPGPHTTFLGERRYAISEIYMCRDEKYLYWRVDYAGKNPVANPPSRTKNGITCQLTILIDQSRQLQFEDQFWRSNNQTHAYESLYDQAKSKYSRLSDTPAVVDSANMLVARVDLAEIKKYCKGPVSFRFDLANNTDNNWEEYLSTSRIAVDFSK